MGQDRIDILTYSTAGLPPAERYAAWSKRDWPRTDAIYRTEPTEPFNTCFDSAQLGSVTVVRTTITGMRWERRIDDIRSSDFDPIIVNMMVDGLAQGDMDGRAFREEAGSFHFHDLARPSLHVSTASFTYSIVLPRAVAAARFGSLDDLHGLVVSGPAARLLIGQAEQLWAALPLLDAAAAPSLANAQLELLSAALADVRPARPAAGAPRSPLRRRAEEEIERRLSTGIVVSDLCAILGVSRARLYAAFQEDGGIMSYAAATRLDRSRSALADLERAEPIGAIAHRLGFGEASQLSRAFRQRFGMSPREYRLLIEADREHAED